MTTEINVKVYISDGSAALNRNNVSSFTIHWAGNFIASPSFTLEKGAPQSTYAFTPNQAVPEPSTAIAMGLLGIVGFAGNRRRRRQVSVV